MGLTQIFQFHRRQYSVILNNIKDHIDQTSEVKAADFISYVHVDNARHPDLALPSIQGLKCYNASAHLH